MHPGTEEGLDYTIKWTEGMKKLVRDDRVIVVNEENGYWLKISKECFDLLQDAVERGISRQTLINEYETEQDRQYVETLLDKLDTVGVLDKGEKEDRRLSQVYILLTHRCNLNCTHCSVSALQSNEDDVLDTDRMFDLFDRVIELKPRQLVLSGGEPLIRKDFEILIKYLADHYDGGITLMTNGTMINEKNIDIIRKYVTNIDISIDGIDEETCTAIRGKGVFKKVICLVKELQKRNFRNISLSMVFGGSNYHLMVPFKEMCKNLGTKAIPRIFSPIGRGEKIKNEFNKVPEGQQCDYKKEQIGDRISVGSCKACKKEYCIDHRGDIYPCVLLMKDKYKLGNIFEDGQSVMSDRRKQEDNVAYKEFSKLFPQKIAKCKDCDLNLFCWSCLHFVDYYMDSDRFDERCTSRREALENAVWGK